MPAACSMSKSIPPEADLICNGCQRQSRCVDDGGQPGPHPPHATLVAQRHQARECGARPRKGRAQDEAADAAADGGRQQYVPGRATTQILRGGMRHAKPAMSGNAPRRPMPLDTLPITSHDAIGSPSLDGATRSRMPSATTPTG